MLEKLKDIELENSTIKEIEMITGERFGGVDMPRTCRVLVESSPTGQGIFDLHGSMAAGKLERNLYWFGQWRIWRTNCRLFCVLRTTGICGGSNG